MTTPVDMVRKNPVKSFRELGISNWLINGMKKLSIGTPSRVQQEAIPAILSYKSDRRTRNDVFACSPTGSGKTLAYVLPILEMVVRDPRPYFALILCPTRELAYQVTEMVKMLTAQSSSACMIKTLMVIGGGSYGDGSHAQELRGLWFGKPNLVIATPGRFLDQLENRNTLGLHGSLRTLSFETVVLDEADQLISESFSEQVSGILSWLDSNEEKHHSGCTLMNQSKRQTLVFSATLTNALEQLSDLIKKKDPTNQPVMIWLVPHVDTVSTALRTNPHLEQTFMLVPNNVKYTYLVEVILDITFRQMIIFCTSKREATLVHRILINLGFSSKGFKFNPVLLNSGMKQTLRFAALDMFKSMKSRILVTTDLANRGLDIPQVDLVINMACPEDPINYVHRVGRTCRLPHLHDMDYSSDLNLMPTTSRLGDTEGDNEKEDGDEDNEDEKEDKTNGDGGDGDVEVDKKRKKKHKIEGKALTFVTQFDIMLLQRVEELIGMKLDKESGIDEDNIPSIIKQVGLATQEAQLSLDQEKQEDEGGDGHAHEVNTMVRQVRKKNRRQGFKRTDGEKGSSKRRRKS